MNTIRTYIRKLINEQFEELDYNPEFDVMDIKDITGDARSQFEKDYEDELKSQNSSLTEPFAEPNDKELENIINALKQADLGLPSEEELVKIAEDNLKRTLSQPELDKIKSTSKQLEKMWFSVNQ